MPRGHWPTRRADVSTDDRTSREQQKDSKPEATNNRAALRRRTPARARSADAPQLRSVTPVVSQFPDVVTADLTARQRRILEFIRTGWSATATRRASARSARRSAWSPRRAWPTSSRSSRRRASCAATPPAARGGRPVASEWSTTRRSARPAPTPAFVPLLGRIAAGGPILAEQAVEDFFPLPRELVGEGEVFMLEVKGDSMIDAASATATGWSSASSRPPTWATSWPP